MSLNTPRIRLLATVLAIFCVFRFTAVNAQVIDVLAISPPILLSSHITVGQHESAKIGLYNRCPLPVDLEIHVTPYPPDGLAGPDYAPYTIPMTIAGEGFQYGDVLVQPTAYGLAHADIDIVPAAVQSQTHACFAPGQDLLLAAVGVFSTINGSIRNVFPIKFKGPSNSDSSAEIGIKPLGDRLVVEPSDTIMNSSGSEDGLRSSEKASWRRPRASHNFSALRSSISEPGTNAASGPSSIRAPVPAPMKAPLAWRFAGVWRCLVAASSSK
jgi:hypothetical protein